MVLDFATVRPGVVLHGLRAEAVTIVAAVPQGPDALALIFRSSDGTLGEQLLYRSDSAHVSVGSPESKWTFDADGREFQLAAEAMRIRLAGLHDPMLAVSSSDIDPLPHQIRAVYGEMLPRTPLRFLLADDPGAGKTIMAGLYAKELMLRGDVARMLIVAPGGLVEQWQDELALKFGIRAELLSRDLIAATLDGNPCAAHPILIARMDQLARDEELLEHLANSQWDLTVVDEAHRMSASWIGPEVRRTRRYELGQRLSAVSRHLLLMTATPHAGSEENYQLFLALLDPDRFEGKYTADVHSTDTTGLMRRMIKEELLTFEGKHLFPERIAETVPYQLSPPERELYEEVTRYVREEMNRADALEDSPRQRTVGFALTVLQRRLASSTHAILRSLQRRRERLEHTRLALVHEGIAASPVLPSGPSLDDYFDDELDSDTAEQLEETVVDAATAARTAEELATEIAVLDRLVELALTVRNLGQDRKWAELRDLILDQHLLRDQNGNRRKLIIFTEHRDTLEYLAAQLRNIVGRDDPVVVIHGGTRREERRRIRERFTNDPTCQVLVATDAAGEGLNLQAAHLMINYDLPWNPNRIEQRFGRIHRIGQQNVCRLWNLVAEDTREGAVFTRLLDKMEAQRKAYGGRLFDVLGEAFQDRPLRELLVAAIRYGDDPARIEEFDRIIDAEVGAGLQELTRERALARETLSPLEVDRMRRQMDEARARRLQPHFIENFFVTAFQSVGGRISPREKDRFEITNVPAALRVRRRPGGSIVPVTTRYERVTFEPSAIERPGAVRAELLAPGHPLMDALLDEIVERHGQTLDRGTVLVDPRDPGAHPTLLVGLTGEIVDGTGRTVSKVFSYARLDGSGGVTDAGGAPYLDVHPIADPALAAGARNERWLHAGVDRLAAEWGAKEFQPEHLSTVRERQVAYLQRARGAVKVRLLQQINYLYSEAGRVRDEIAAGSKRRRRISPDRMEAMAAELDARLEKRLERIDLEMQLAAKEPRVVSAALIVPAGMLSGAAAAHAKQTQAVERRAVDAVLRAERMLGRVPTEMAHNNKGYDISSTRAGEADVHIEVKGRISGADDVTVTYSELIHGKNLGEQHRLALVEVSPDSAEQDRLRYVGNAFADVNVGGLPVKDTRLEWAAMWERGREPF
nr:helicase-related protein [Skermania sp. ID1734]